MYFFINMRKVKSEDDDDGDEEDQEGEEGENYNKEVQIFEVYFLKGCVFESFFGENLFW